MDDISPHDEDFETDSWEGAVKAIPELGRLFSEGTLAGEGTFSRVWAAKIKNSNGEIRALKLLHPTAHPSRTARELRCLRELGNKHNIIGVELSLRWKDHVALVMPHIPHERFSEYVGVMSKVEGRRYMRALLQALRHLHRARLIHRDVKPSNFLYDRRNQRFRLCDFGLAQSEASVVARYGRAGVRAGTGSAPSAACCCAGGARVCEPCARAAECGAPRAGTQGYRAPEVLLKYPYQTTAVDMWSCGVVYLGVLGARSGVLRARPDLDALLDVAALLGTRQLQQAARALGRRVVVGSPRRGLDLPSLCRYLRNPILFNGIDACAECLVAPCICRTKETESALDKNSEYGLLQAMLAPNPYQRITAEQALQHPVMQNC